MNPLIIARIRIIVSFIKYITNNEDFDSVQRVVFDDSLPSILPVNGKVNNDNLQEEDVNKILSYNSIKDL